MQIQGFTLKLDDSALPWRTTRHAGIAWLPLHPDAPEAGAGVESRSAESLRGAVSSHAAARPRDTTVLIRMDPGCGYPRHRHFDVEEVLILRGGYRDERGEHGAGTYLRYEAGSVHAPVALGDPGRPIGPENQACLLFAVARGGVENLD